MKGGWLERLIELPDQGGSIPLGETRIIVVPAHFLHSVGNFQFYDPISKILFSGDMGHLLLMMRLHQLMILPVIFLLCVDSTNVICVPIV
ncbi:MAG: hypothetical protein GAK29_00319 [Acinetobacter bereziniae]|uniref:ODP domain-containing protein n=1 Tax=Acinetobacter bereziniae TaxID=106648 RepID=A0A833PHZ2_ACIBZ|nr:MAG: hypothetical protein GAK29_00319 [Acinetobacter bereziniae]